MANAKVANFVGSIEQEVNKGAKHASGGYISTIANRGVRLW
jgi:hypothetical protein